MMSIAWDFSMTRTLFQALLPVMIVYLVFQRQILNGAIAGAVK